MFTTAQLAQPQKPAKRGGISKLANSSERQGQFQIQGPAAEGLVSFFEDAGVPIQSPPGEPVILNGKVVVITPEMRALLRKDGVNSLIDEIAMQYAREKFVKALKDNTAFGDGVRAVPWRDKALKARSRARRRGGGAGAGSPQQGADGFEVTRGTARLAVIRATAARVEGGVEIQANFLKPGAHWRQLADGISAVESRRAAERRTEQERAAAALAQAKAELLRRAAVRRVDKLPPGLAPGLADACLNASRRIRLERQVAYDRPVVLQNESGELRLLPIISTGIRLLLPFRLSNGSGSVEGRLELIVDDPDPLPLLIDRNVPKEDTIRAWACALIGFADATCIEIEPKTSRQRRTGAPSHPAAPHLRTACPPTARLAQPPGTSRSLGPVQRIVRRRPPTATGRRPDGQRRGHRQSTPGRHHPASSRDMGPAALSRRPGEHRDAIPLACTRNRRTPRITLGKGHSSLTSQEAPRSNEVTAAAQDIPIGHGKMTGRRGPESPPQLPYGLSHTERL